MPNTTMKTQIQVRRDTTANWLANCQQIKVKNCPAHKAVPLLQSKIYFDRNWSCCDERKS